MKCILSGVQFIFRTTFSLVAPDVAVVVQACPSRGLCKAKIRTEFLLVFFLFEEDPKQKRAKKRYVCYDNKIKSNGMSGWSLWKVLNAHIFNPRRWSTIYELWWTWSLLRYSLVRHTHTHIHFILLWCYFDSISCFAQTKTQMDTHIIHVQTHNHIRINCVYRTLWALIWLLFARTVFFRFVYTLWTLEIIIIYFWYIVHILLLRPHNSQQSYRRYDTLLLSACASIILWMYFWHSRLSIFLFQFKYASCSRIYVLTHTFSPLEFASCEPYCRCYDTSNRISDWMIEECSHNKQQFMNKNFLYL